jgi:glycosyltransferase involved in cell wall biosynthesis
MKICMFTNTYLPHVGGVARSVASFTSDLRAMGHQVLVIAPTFSGTDVKTSEQGVLRVPAIQNFNGSDFSVRLPLPFTISEEIDAFDPDLIHSHHPFLLGDTALRAARQRKLPLIFTHHTLYEQYTHYVPFDSNTMKRFVIHLSTQYANLCTAVVAPSQSVAQLLRGRGVTRPIVEIPTGVDVGFFSKGSGDRFRKSLNIPDNAFLLGHLGRLAPEKNLRYLAEAAANFVQNQQAARFLVVGDGPSRQDILAIFSRQGLEDRLILAGKMTGRDLADAYAAMDLFAFASKSETQGMVLVEAMAASTPVVALDAPGAREVVRDGENGRLLGENAPPQEFAEALSQPCQDPRLLEAWSGSARRQAERFSRERCAETLQRTFQSFTSRAAEQWPPAASQEALISLETAQRALKTEWDLISEKTSAVVSAFKEELTAGKRSSKPRPEES